MRTEATRIDIACAPEHVWDVVADVVRWPQWTPSITQVEPLDRPELAIGHRYRIRQPGTRAMVWTVTRLEPGSAFWWATGRSGTGVEARHAVAPVPAGSRVHLQLGFSGPLGGLVALLTRTRNRRYLRMEAMGLKDRCEASWRGPVVPGTTHGGGDA